MIQLENDFLSATVHPKGAELQTLCRKDNGLAYLWKGDPAYWGKHSPILFPIVGSLKENQYYFDGKAYTLPRHGFARDKTFEAIAVSSTEALFTLTEDTDTLAVYPFPFVLEVHYRLEGPLLEVRYIVRNPAKAPMYFSLGAHPAFAVPLVEGDQYGDYALSFSHKETAGRWGLINGLLKNVPTPFLSNTQQILLYDGLFAEDALVFKGLRSDYVTLTGNNTPHGLRMRIGGWPDLGIWAAPGAPFVCIEPWQGHADFVNHDQELIHKEGVVALHGGKYWEKAWDVTLF
jgi:galactose mutarotase-like enzyme